MMYTIRFCIPYTLYYSLCQLTQLEILHIGANPLNIVPEVVSSLTSLKELDMVGCELSTLPERFVCHIFVLCEKLLKVYCL